MYTFSEQHPWQGDVAVQQILVFSFHETMKKFNEEMERRFKRDMDSYAGVDPNYPTKVRNDLSDSNAGAIYKLRGVMNSNNTYAAVIRCGFTGNLIWEDYAEYTTPKLALIECLKKLKTSPIEVIDKQIKLYS